jgi:cytochrome c553
LNSASGSLCISALARAKAKSGGRSAKCAQTGERLAIQHRCKSCHGDDYNGFRAAARLSDQREDVLLKALRDFRTGKRISSGVASWRTSLMSLTDVDMVALSHYMSARP